jgi:hypothetical protein
MLINNQVTTNYYCASCSEVGRFVIASLFLFNSYFCRSCYDDYKEELNEQVK